MTGEQLEVETLAGARGGQRVLRLSGPLTMATVSVLHGAIREQPAASLIIDLSQVPYMDSSGLGALIQAYVSHQRGGGRIALAGANQRATALLQMTNVEQLFSIFPTLAEAEQGLAQS